MILIALALLASVDDWIDRVQPDCAEVRYLAGKNEQESQMWRSVGNFEKDPAKKGELLKAAGELHTVAEQYRRSYEKCRDTAPKVKSEEQARREEQQAKDEELKHLFDKPRHPEGAIAPMPPPRPPPPPPPPASAEELRLHAERERIRADPAQLKEAKTAWTCWDGGGRFYEMKEQKDPKEIARLRRVGCYRPRVKELLRCMDRVWVNGEKFGEGDPCLGPLERFTVDQAG